MAHRSHGGGNHRRASDEWLPRLAPYREPGTLRAMYLDHAASTPPLPEVVDAVAATMHEAFGNPSSTHGPGTAARRLLEDSREFLRGSLGAARLVFTSGGTEADCLGVVGAAWARPAGRVLVGAADHAAVLSLDQVLGKRHALSAVPVGTHGVVEPETLFEALGPDVRVVSILHGHNELGSLADVEELAEVIRRVSPDAHVHVDLVQSYGKLDFDLDRTGIDSVAVSGHKLHGPRGIGFLALSSKARVAPIVAGGGQEDGLRGGTQNLPGAVGLARAAEYMLTHLAHHAAHTSELCERMFALLQDELREVDRLGDPEHRLPHILSVRIPGITGQALQEACADRGVAFSTGAACHGDDDAENHVLRAIGLSRRDARRVVRMSFSPFDRFEDIDRAAQIVIEEAERLLAVPAPDGGGKHHPGAK